MPAKKLYADIGSSPCRIVAMTLDVIGLEYEYVPTNPLAGETNTPEFLKINMQHNVPVFIDEDGFNMNESRPIAVYLAQKYDKSGKLFPDDIKTQAIINQVIIPYSVCSTGCGLYFYTLLKVSTKRELL